MDTPTGSCNSEELIDAQTNFEKRFSCPVCLDPKLKMVVSSCQHRTCSDCLYKYDKKLNAAMKKCPTCQRKNVFPETRPDIPEDNIEMQRQMGVTECPMDGCSAGLWMWDVENHIESCPYAVVSPKPGSKRRQTTKPNEPDENSVKTPRTKRQKQATMPTPKASAEDTPSTSRITRSCSNLNQSQPPHKHPIRNRPQQGILREFGQCGQYGQYGQYFPVNYNVHQHDAQYGQNPNRHPFQPQRYYYN